MPAHANDNMSDNAHKHDDGGNEYKSIHDCDDSNNKVLTTVSLPVAVKFNIFNDLSVLRLIVFIHSTGNGKSDDFTTHPNHEKSNTHTFPKQLSSQN